MNTLYNVSLMNTLWENTYRAMVQNEKGEYIASLRLLVAVPKDRSEIPAEAPEVGAVLHVLVEDATIKSSDIIEFETQLTSILMEKFKQSIHEMYYFYPSPEDMLKKTAPATPLQ